MICMTQADRIYLSEEREAAEAAAVVQQGSVPVSLTRAFDDSLWHVFDKKPLTRASGMSLPRCCKSSRWA